MRIFGLGIAALALAAAACSGPRQPAGASDGKTLVTADKTPSTASPSPGSEDVAIVDADGNQVDGISKGDLDDAIKRETGAEGGFEEGEDPAAGDAGKSADAPGET